MDTERLLDLEWYVDAKNYALDDIRLLVVPVNYAQMRIAYGNYFVSLVSLTEAICEYVADGRTFIYSAFDGLNGLPGQQNYEYLKNLRNAVIHRGMNIAAAGIKHGNRVCLRAPPTVSDKKGKKTYRAFATFVEEIIVYSEFIVGPAVDKALASQGVWSADELDQDELLIAATASINDIKEIPPQLRDLATKSIAGIDLVMLYRQRRDSFRTKLKARDVRAGWLDCPAQ